MTPALAQLDIAPNPQVSRTQRHLAILDGLIEAGAHMIQRHQQQNDARAEAAAAAAEPIPAAELEHEAGAYERITRSVRRSILLCEQLSEPKAVPQHQRTDARKRIIRRVEDTIHQEASGERAEQLHAELHERLDSPELEDDIDHRPVEEIINEIRRDLGLDLPQARRFKRRTPGDIAELHARAAAPCGSAPGVTRPSVPSPSDRGTPHASPPDTTGPDERLDPAREVSLLLDYAARFRGGG